LQGRPVEVLQIELFVVACSPVEKTEIGAFEGGQGSLRLRESPCPD